MKIGLICYPTIGGSGIVATELGKALSDMNHETHFIAYQEPVRLNSFDTKIKFHKVEVSQYPLFHYQPYELTLTSKIIEVVKNEALDLLHVHYAIPHASAAFMAKQILASEGINIPYITTLHGTDITLLGKSNSFKPVIQFAISNSDIVTSVSNHLKEETLKNFDISKPIEVVPNFIRKKDYKSSQDSSILRKHLVGNSTVICHASNFRKVKRTPDVVSIFEGIQKVTDAKLILLGDGPEMGEVKQLVKEKQLTENVIFLGKVSDVASILCICDLFLMTSENESFGLSALEAMACGCPVVSTNAGGLPEVNIHGISGLLGPVGDIHAMTNLSLEVLNNLKHYKKGALQIASHFECKNVLPLYLKIYKTLINQSS